MNRRTIATGILTFIALFFLGGCVSFSGQVIHGSGRVAQESRPVSGIQSIDLQGSGDVILTQGDHEALTVEAEDNILPEIETRMDGSRLVLGFKHSAVARSIDATRPIRFLLTVKDVQGIVLAGSGNISTNSLKTTSLDLTISGSGNIDVNQATLERLTANL